MAADALARLKESEDLVTHWLDGGPCSHTSHRAPTTLDMLVMLKQLRIRMPHRASALSELDAAIRLELRRGGC